MENVQGTYKLVKKASTHTFLIGLVGMLMGIIPYFFLIRTELWEAAMYLSILLIPLSIMGVVLIVHSFYYKVVITENTILLRLPSTKRSFSFDEIRGFRKSPGYIYIYSKKKKISISVYTESIDKIYEWLQLNYTDLDQLPPQEDDLVQRFNRFQANHFPDLGLNETKEDESTINFDENEITFSKSYKRKLKIAKYVTYVYCVLVFLISALLWIYPFLEHLFLLPNYNYIFFSAVLIVPIGIIIPKISNGFIVHSFREKEKPNITKILFIPWVGLFLPTYFIHVLDSNLVWLYSYGIGISLTLLVLMAKEFKFKQLQTYFYAAFFLFCFTAYGRCIIILGNSFYDEPNAKEYKAKVIKKKNYNDNPRLQLSKWHETYDMNTIRVNIEEYNRVEKNDSITIYVKEGKFGVDWFILR